MSSISVLAELSVLEARISSFSKEKEWVEEGGAPLLLHSWTRNGEGERVCVHGPGPRKGLQCLQLAGVDAQIPVGVPGRRCPSPLVQSGPPLGPGEEWCVSEAA